MAQGGFGVQSSDDAVSSGGCYVGLIHGPDLLDDRFFARTFACCTVPLQLTAQARRHHEASQYMHTVLSLRTLCARECPRCTISSKFESCGPRLLMTPS